MANLVAQEAVDHVNGYQVLGVLGQGRMGILYVAQHLGVEGQVRVVALRCLDPRLGDNTNLETSILDSVRIAAGLDHPNIIATYELAHFNGQHFFTMEYLPGEDLASILAECGSHRLMPPQIAAVLVQQCANGLAYAHRACETQDNNLRPVHREVSPSKIFVTYQGGVKLLGLGVAPIPGEAIDISGGSQNRFAYTAPENLDGAGSDARSDLFSLGVVLWECLTGRRLFSADTPAKTMDAVRSRYVEPPSVFRSEVPPALDEIALRALGRDPRRRYQSAEEMSFALQAAVDGLDRRPIAHDIAAWLEQLFGEERASLKKQISKATAAESALAELRLLGELDAANPQYPASIDGATTEGPFPTIRSGQSDRNAGREPQQIVRLAPSQPPFPFQPPRVVPTSLPDPPSSPRIGPSAPAHSVATVAVGGVDPAVSSAPARPSSQPSRWRPNMLAICGVLAGLSAVAVLVLFFNQEDGLDPANRVRGVTASVGALQVQSSPPGGQVLIDGDPSGFATPARIGGLRAGRKVEVRVDKVGYKSAKQTVEVPAGGPRLLSFVLEESIGRIRLEGVPPRATVYVDDTPVGSKEPFSLSVGPHRLRIEVSGQLFASQPINVRPGEQTVRIYPSQASGR